MMVMLMARMLSDDHVMDRHDDVDGEGHGDAVMMMMLILVMMRLKMFMNDNIHDVT